MLVAMEEVSLTIDWVINGYACGSGDYRSGVGDAH
jgi:hypothetical protein